jgi:hypothetical protein
MLDKLTESTFARMAVLGIALATTPVYGKEDYPVYEGSPSKETFGKQWVTQPTETTQTPLSNPTESSKIVYSLEADVDNRGMLTLTGERTTFAETYQDFLFVITQDQVMYRPKCKALVYPALGLAITGLVGMGVGSYGVLVGAGSEDGEIAAIGGAIIGGGCVLAYGSTFGIIKPCSKFKPTDNTRTTELSRTTQTQRLSSIPTRLASAPNTPYTITSEHFTYQRDPWLSVSGSYTDSQGNASVQLVPTDSNFAFSQQGLADIPFAQQLQNAGYSQDRFLPLLQQQATPVTYYVTIETKAKDGENAKLDVPVQGVVVPASAMEKIVMGL